MKKSVKLLSVFMSAMLGMSTFTLIPTTASAAEITDNSASAVSGDFQYSVKDDKATITGYTGSDSAVIIPGFIDGHKVSAIGDYAFSGNKSIETVTLPSTLTSIGSSAFADAEALKTVKFSDNLKEIGVSAFYNCDKLISVNIPDGITKIQDYTFSDCDSLRDVSFPNTVESIGNNAFENCEKLENIYFKGSVSVGDDAFRECSKLEYINFDKVTSVGFSSFSSCYKLEKANLSKCSAIGDYAFFGCVNLKDINFPDEIYSISQSAFEYTAWVQTAPEGILYAGNLAFSIIGDFDEKNVKIKDGTIAINDDFLTNNESVESISLPDSVENIGTSAFEGCSNLKEITIPDQCKVQAMAFAECSSLADINYNEDNVWTAPSAFNNTAWYNSQPDGILYHGTSACAYKGDFAATESIKDGTTIIVDGLFYADEELTSIDIPDSVEYIGNMAFEDCVNLKKITLPKSLYTVCNETFLGCESLESVEISEVVNIGESAFAHCTNLKNIVIPNSVNQSIGDCAFLNCTSLEKVTINGDIQMIGTAAFMNCESLKSINIPESVISMGNDVFEFCDNLTIYCYGNSYAHKYAQDNELNFTLITNDRQLGDINNDGKVDVNDVTQLQKYLAGFTDENDQPLLSESELIYADMTKDGIIDSRDITALQIFLSEK